MAPRKHVVFDVVGTCVSYQVFFDCVHSTLGAKLRAQGIRSQVFAFAWMESAEREFAYLSISERYKPFMEVFKALFYRILWMSGIEEPRTIATDEERDKMLASYGRLETRPGIGEAMGKLRAAGFEVWCFTTGDKKRVRGYFERAGIEMPEANFVSCDTAGVAKPALAAYRSVLDKFDVEDEKWFAAAHMWDVSAAKQVGFRGAYCTVYEKEACAELFGGEVNVTADTLIEMAEKLIAASGP